LAVRREYRAHFPAPGYLTVIDLLVAEALPFSPSESPLTNPLVIAELEPSDRVFLIVPEDQIEVLVHEPAPKTFSRYLTDIGDLLEHHPFPLFHNRKKVLSIRFFVRKFHHNRKNGDFWVIVSFQ
jgi:hypothetical protein